MFQDRDDRPRIGHRDPLVCLDTVGADVTGRDDRRQGAKWVIGRQGFDGEHVESRTAQVTGLQCRHERRLIHEATACRVHEERARLGARKEIGVHEPASLGQERDVEREDVRAREQGVELDQLHTQPARGFGIGVRIPAGTFDKSTCHTPSP